MNIVLLILELILSSLITIYLFKKFKYEGLSLCILVFSILLGIVSQKTVEIFNLEINLGIVINTLIFIISNIIIQKKGPNEITKTISLVIVGNVSLYTFSILTSIMSISSINEISNISFSELFYLNTRVYFSSIISLIISLYINSMLYHQIRQIKNKIWISNILSTIIIQFIESIIFCLLAYIFKMSLLNVIELIVIRYIFKTIIGIIGTNIIYITNSIER